LNFKKWSTKIIKHLQRPAVHLSEVSGYAPQSGTESRLRETYPCCHRANFPNFISNNFIRPKKYAIFVNLSKRQFSGVYPNRANRPKAGETVPIKAAETKAMTAIIQDTFNK
jgi:hypothetical protein